MKQKFRSLSNLRVAVLCGGTSSERAISLKSGKAIYEALRNQCQHCSLIDIKRPRSVLNQLKEIDVVCIALHGERGEDGEIQSILKRGKKIYTGSDSQASRTAFHKIKAKKLFKKNGIGTPSFIEIKRGFKRWDSPILQKAFFLKSIQNGSSIGVYKIEGSEKKVRDQVERYIKKHGDMFAEQNIDGREFTVGILNDRPLPAIELKPQKAFYDYKAKYTKGMTRYIVPAKIPKELEKKIKRLAVKAHKVLGLRDFSRVDFMVDKNNTPYVLEVNSIPGFTELSLLPKAANCVGISFNQLCEKIILLALKH